MRTPSPTAAIWPNRGELREGRSRQAAPSKTSTDESGLLLICNFFGWLWHGEPAAYGYLARSIKYFATNQEFTRVLREIGFQVVAERPKLAGALYLHLAQKVTT